MAEPFAGKPFTSSPATQAAFSNYLETHPNKRRVTRLEREELIGWLTNHHAPLSSQKEFSRRKDVRKTFTWDQDGQMLAAVSKNGGEKRTVITEDCIIEVVELVHTTNGHAGWDATWRDVNHSYYGIMRADVIFLLKRCDICVSNPRKRPKGSNSTKASPDRAGLEAYERQNDKDLLSLVHHEDSFMIEALDMAMPYERVAKKIVGGFRWGLRCRSGSELGEDILASAFSEISNRNTGPV
ncbi:uncharacterized protein B0I36DRAFT_389017 [Microdochium trichocladiopsis]|uniref:Integrase zinc-binding domain-containing protein n=1 Tax=Microdochium trichocladiopsis TaxID=1682393 RepID=A0A9P8XTF9_9PEZI|nr:uncharacterized protein B0I36DRAFT_389017 [Microdochium trichocladiopsis]KAH7016440.1 hypothetical protein B0I36DRAFT_389017 [Microdochium trichocladiopsis]